MKSQFPLQPGTSILRRSLKPITEPRRGLVFLLALTLIWFMQGCMPNVFSDRTFEIVAPLMLALGAICLIRMYRNPQPIPNAALGVPRIVAENSELRSSLQESIAQFRALADALPHLAWLAGPDGTIQWVNQQWLEFTGQKKDEALGWNWVSLVGSTEVARVIETWKNAVKAGSIWEEELPLRRRDGSEFWHLSRALPIRAQDGTVVQWFGTHTDITEQREVLDRETSARIAAENASRMRDEFLATLSHELRTPLNAILGWAQILQRAKRSESEMKEGLAIIDRNARAQAQLIEDLLDMSRVSSGKVRLHMQRIPLANVIEAALATALPSATTRRITMTQDIDPTIHVVGDPGRLQQVFWNLLSNAVKFTPFDGAVGVSMKKVGNFIEIKVTDSGQGMTKDFLPHIFQRFSQADSSATRRTGGLGIGLSLVKSLVELHGGRVQGASEGAGRGSTFTVELPVPALNVPVATNSHSRVVRDEEMQTRDTDLLPSLAGLRILVVDDEPDARTMVKRMLSESGAEVITAASATEAIELFHESKPDILISDIGMPETDGYELIQQIRSDEAPSGGQVPAIALTAFAATDDRARALKAGFQVHLSKPIDHAAIIKAVAALKDSQ